MTDVIPALQLLPLQPSAADTAISAAGRAHHPGRHSARRHAARHLPAAPGEASRPARDWLGGRGGTDLPITERARIGDELRLPIAWCEQGSCISRHEDARALGEADIRARAVESGWRHDAFGRLTCPECQQSRSSFWTTRPVMLWDRSRAISMAARLTVRPSGQWPAAAAAGPRWDQGRQL